MGQVVSLLKIASVSAMLLSDTAAMAEPTTLFVGPMGSGKTSTIKNLCGADLKTGNGMFSVTPEMQAVRCNGQTRLDTAGLLHLTEGDSDNGAYRGLLTLLESLEGKEVGRIYVVISSSQAKNHGDVLGQVKLLQDLINPLIPWTTVVNCFNSICPSAHGGPSEFLVELNKLTEGNIEVSSPHEQEIDKALFPAPTTSFKVNLPPNWREKIAMHDLNGLRKDAEVQARGNCDTYGSVIKSAKKELSKQFTCSQKNCPRTDCATLAACPSPSCPEFSCDDHNPCQKCHTKSWRCGRRLFVKKCHKTVCEDDHDCKRSVNECQNNRKKHCDNHAKSVDVCNEKRNKECQALTNSYNKCAAERATGCDAEKKKHDEAQKKVLREYEPYYAQCVQKYGYAAI